MPRFFFRLTAAATTAFIITIFVMIAIMLGDPIAPVNIWFNDHGTTILGVEVVAIVLCGLAAMTMDRRETIREQARQTDATGDSTASNP